VGGGDHVVLEDLVLSSEGDVVLAGLFWGFAIVGGRGMMAEGDPIFDLYVARYDQDGRPRHTQQFSVPTGWLEEVHAAPTSEDGLALCGSFRGEIALGSAIHTSAASSRDVFLALLDGEGTVEHTQRITSDYEAGCSAVAVDEQGYVHTAGHFQDVVDIGGSVHGTPGDGIFLALHDTLLRHENHSVFVSAGTMETRGMALLASDRLVLVGITTDPVNLGIGGVCQHSSFVAVMPRL
jgi:hypothetical protein